MSKTRLDHPLKRLSFIMFICSGISLIGMALLPRPFELNTYSEWKDVSTTETPDRYVTQIDTICASTHTDGLNHFAKDFFILDALNSESVYAPLMTKDQLDSNKPINIAPTVELTNKEKAAYISSLSSTSKPCFDGYCVSNLDAPLFKTILKSCSKLVGQRRTDISSIQWRVRDNLHSRSPWPLTAFLSSVAFLFLSLLYNQTLKKIVTWIRTGTW